MATSREQNNFDAQKTILFSNIRTRQCSGKKMTVNVMIISILKGKINCMDICSNGVCMGFCCGLTLIVSWFYFSGPDIMKSPLSRIQCTKPIWYIKRYMFSDRATKFAYNKREKLKIKRLRLIYIRRQVSVNSFSYLHCSIFNIYTDLSYFV